MENNTLTHNKDINTDKVLQGVASLGSERPEKSDAGTEADSDRLKTRTKYSGAARRRYKKQLQREREDAKALTPLPAAASTAKNKGEGTSEGAGKRTRREAITPSPEHSRQGKKPKVTDQGTFAQATKGLVRMALVYEGYPDKRLGASEVTEIRKKIRGRILELAEGTKAPTFTGSWERDGAMVIACADGWSGDWLKGLASELAVGDAPLRVLPIEELPKRHRLIVHVEEPDLTAQEALKLLDRQNTGLAASEWVVTRGSESRDATSSHFACLVGDSSLEALKTCGLKPFCGLGRATVKVLGRERKGEARVEVAGVGGAV